MNDEWELTLMIGVASVAVLGEVLCVLWMLHLI